MICRNCNNEVEDSSIMCPICGEAVAKRPSYTGTSYMDMKFDSNDNVGSFSQPSEGYYKYKNSKKSVTSVVITLLVVACLVLGGVIFYKNVLHKGGRYDGKYLYDSMIYEGQTYPKELTSAFGYDPSYLSFEIKGDEIDIVIEAFGTKVPQPCELVNDSGDIKIICEGELVFTGTLIGDKLTIDGEGGSLVFKRK